MPERKTDTEILGEYVRKVFPEIENTIGFRFYIFGERLKELGKCVVEGLKIKEAADYLLKTKTKDEPTR